MNEKAALLRSLHTPGTPLVLVNAWDAATARIAAAAGSPAVATTSAGVAWSLGAADGDTLGRDDAIALIRRVVAAVAVPVTADIESGFGAAPADVAETVRLVVAAGAAGVNIEDGSRTVEEQTARIAAARAAAGDDLFINARLDAYLRGRGDLDETVARAEALVEAGADGIFVPGVTDPSTVAALAGRIAAPLNILTGPGAPTVGELAKLGVARVSLGSWAAEAAYAMFGRVTRQALDQGTYAEELAESYDYGELNDLMRYSA
ncbi:isocitrate lyase/PEP mutase family protein [Paractinoplanes atraurantiacus]|uniref:2-Methylisocitrate lyase, PEP mutase family n=1 Tax=Paractinoplanes atraurantiacus TaxID=1036182 RepID=A0A285FF23_9ACTN|nr:isocitrate lyase/phosphoenolpyruvate mutase family protein [Actinoplanes atraurantiacus]SNY09374.1 2-Methylisocitrate lyase, PEP mutase family [Actinoplanes atraurantiacus]